MCKIKCEKDCSKCPMSKDHPALSKVVEDLLDTVIMLNDEHGKDLSDVLINDKSLHSKLSQVEWLLFTTRQKRKGD